MRFTSLAAIVLLPVAALGAPRLPDGAEVGDTVSYAFREAPLGSLGLGSMDELRGKPVLIDFWGTR